ncbi:MAG TPA: hypothetical protein VFM24_03755, partial [Nitrospira sp.]|nr:hypothetical protein [Nitrospira sp.]
MHEPVRFKRASVLLIVSIVVLTWSSPLKAQENKAEDKTAEQNSETPLKDKLMIRGGWAYVFGATANVAV